MPRATPPRVIVVPGARLITALKSAGEVRIETPSAVLRIPWIWTPPSLIVAVCLTSALKLTPPRLIFEPPPLLISASNLIAPTEIAPS